MHWLTEDHIGSYSLSLNTMFLIGAPRIHLLSCNCWATSPLPPVSRCPWGGRGQKTHRVDKPVWNKGRERQLTQSTERGIIQASGSLCILCGLAVSSGLQSVASLLLLGFRPIGSFLFYQRQATRQRRRRQQW